MLLLSLHFASGETSLASGRLLRCQCIGVAVIGSRTRRQRGRRFSGSHCRTGRLSERLCVVACLCSLSLAGRERLLRSLPIANLLAMNLMLLGRVRAARAGLTGRDFGLLLLGLFLAGGSQVGLRLGGLLLLDTLFLHRLLLRRRS